MKALMNLNFKIEVKKTLKLNAMKKLAIAKTVKPARRCQNFSHWSEYIKETVQTLKLKENGNNKSN